MRRKLSLIVAAVVCGALGTFLLVRFVRSAEDRAAAGETRVKVYVVTEQIQPGTTGIAVADMVEEREIPERLLLPGAIQPGSLSAIADQVANTTLFLNDQLVYDRFSAIQDIESTQTRVHPPEGFVEVTLPPLDPSRVLGGLLSPGDSVAVIASFRPFQVLGEEVEIDGEQVEVPPELAADTTLQTPDTTHVLLHKVLVTEVQLQGAVPVAPTGPDGEPAPVVTGPIQSPTGSFLVTLAVDTPSAERLVFTAEYGSFWLVREPDDAPENGTKIQTRASIYQDTVPRSSQQ